MTYLDPGIISDAEKYEDLIVQVMMSERRQVLWRAAILLVVVISVTSTGTAVERDTRAVTELAARVETLPDRKTFEAQTGVKLGLGERLAYNIYRKRLDRAAKSLDTDESGKPRRQALLGLSFGIIAVIATIFIATPWLGWLALLFIPGLILSVIALNKSKTMEDPSRVRGIAIAGVIISSLVPLFWIIALIAVAIAWA